MIGQPMADSNSSNRNPLSKAWQLGRNFFNSGSVRRTRVVMAIVAAFLIGAGFFGVRDVLKLSSSGTYPDPTNYDSPYGFTLRDEPNHPAGSPGNGIDSELISEYKDLNVHWVRDQMKWSWTETQPGVYNWTQLDQQVQLANQNGMHIVYVFQAAPSWHQITCPTDGFKHEFDVPGITAFATAVASRYNGLNGHGYIDAFEIGNEDFDNHWTGSMAGSLPCRGPNTFVPVLEA